ncbi:MAG: TRAP transporter small permease [Lachnospiraceae bacterium]|nr:TRAP transporter small permease [Lachnospiraceae bacterium]
MKALHSIRKAIDVILSSACALIFAAMVVIGTYQIVTRFIFRNPSTVSEELLTYSFTWMALLASAYVFGKRDHMRMGFMADKLGKGGQKVLNIVSEILIMILAGSVMIYGGFTIMQLTMTQSTASLGIPMGVVYTIVPVSGIIIVIYSILNIIDLVAGVEREQREVKE